MNFTAMMDNIENYNNIGINSSLDWKRIRKLLKIGLFAALIVLAGDMLLGWGVTDESKSGIEQFFSRYLSVSDGRIFWLALFGLIGIPLECLCYFGIYRMIAPYSPKLAHAYRSGIFGVLIFGGAGVHVPYCAAVYFYRKINVLSPDVTAETLKFAEYFLIPATLIFFVFFIILITVQIKAFASENTPLPKWCWIFSVIFGIALAAVLKLFNTELTNALATGWISLGNLWLFGGLLVVSRKIK